MSPPSSPVVATVVLPSQDSLHLSSKGAVERLEHIAGFYEVDPRAVHPLHAAAQPSQEALRNSASAPVIVTPNPMVKQQVGRAMVDCHKDTAWVSSEATQNISNDALAI